MSVSHLPPGITAAHVIGAPAPMLSLSNLERNLHRLHDSLLFVVRETMEDEGYGEDDWLVFLGAYYAEVAFRAMALQEQAGRMRDEMTANAQAYEEQNVFADLSPIALYLLFDRLALEVFDLANEIGQEQGLGNLGTMARCRLRDIQAASGSANVEE